MKIKWLIRSQSIVTLASGMIYPYYLLFLKNLGNSYSKYGLAFAVFTLSSAITSQVLASRLDSRAHEILVLSSIGMMIAMVAFPWVLHFAWVIVLQLLMGICNAMQRTSERVLLADHTTKGDRGKDIGNYHFWTSIASGFAVIVGGYMIDWLTIDVLFYISAVLYGVSAWMIGRNSKTKAKSKLSIEKV
ncbi:MFS transporter [Shimazuella sp. AN120528]|uniref:MFS transporter n=1 Tax=Shimazuella soli TaxID=1892854 RepID=UPI001F0F044A|nr:MFS transporter [Shimazuella soli]MCH5585813.1 MFS transporter [Shimazuella soli]